MFVTNGSNDISVTRTKGLNIGPNGEERIWSPGNWNTQTKSSWASSGNNLTLDFSIIYGDRTKQVKTKRTKQVKETDAIIQRDNCLCCTSSTGEQHVGRTEELHSILLSIPLSASNSVKPWLDCAGGENYGSRDAGTNPHHGAMLEAAEPCGDPLCQLRAQRVAGISGGSTEPCAWGIPWQPQI